MTHKTKKTYKVFTIRLDMSKTKEREFYDVLCELSELLTLPVSTTFKTMITAGETVASLKATLDFAKNAWKGVENEKENDQ